MQRCMRTVTGSSFSSRCKLHIMQTTLFSFSYYKIHNCTTNRKVYSIHTSLENRLLFCLYNGSSVDSSLSFSICLDFSLPFLFSAAIFFLSSLCISSTRLLLLFSLTITEFHSSDYNRKRQKVTFICMFSIYQAECFTSELHSKMVATLQICSRKQRFSLMS